MWITLKIKEEVKIGEKESEIYEIYRFCDVKIKELDCSSDENVV